MGTYLPDYVLWGYTGTYLPEYVLWGYRGTYPSMCSGGTRVPTRECTLRVPGYLPEYGQTSRFGNRVPQGTCPTKPALQVAIVTV